MNADGRRLAKRDGAVTVPDLAAVGVDAAAVLALIAESLGLPAPRRLPDLLTSFDPDALPRDPWVFPVIAPMTAKSADFGLPGVDRVRIPGMQANTVGG